MKIKACCIGTPLRIIEAFSGAEFANEVLTEVVGKCLGVKDVLDRPAEYYVENADEGPAPKEGKMGVAVQLTGAGREGRTPRQFHSALAKLKNIVMGTIRKNLLTDEGDCQVFVVIMLDGGIETWPQSGKYSCNLEATANLLDEWT